jgi:solute carrier family 45 protein 1/2/4
MGEEGINATRDGSLALLIFALISVLVMFLLPHIRQTPGSPPLSYKGIRLRGLSMAWIWALSFWLFALCLFSTYFSSGPVSAIAIIASCGFSWGVTQWVPFTLMGEFVSDGLANYEAAGNGLNDGFQRDVESRDPLLSGGASTDTIDILEKDSPKSSLSNASKASSTRAPPLDAGMALGIHNIYIVLPQFLSTFISSLVFMYTGSLRHGEDGTPAVDEFGWVLRIGATAAIVAGFVALRVEEVPESSRNGKKELD